MDTMTNSIFGRHVMLRKCTRSQHRVRASCLSSLISEGCSGKKSAPAACAQSCETVFIWSNTAAHWPSEDVSNTHTCVGRMADREKIIKTDTKRRTIDDSEWCSCRYRTLPLGAAIKQDLGSNNGTMINYEVTNWCAYYCFFHIYTCVQCQRIFQLFKWIPLLLARCSENLPKLNLSFWQSKNHVSHQSVCEQTVSAGERFAAMAFVATVTSHQYKTDWSECVCPSMQKI